MPSDNARAIRKHRARRLYALGYDQDTVASVIGVSKPTVSRWTTDLVPKTPAEWRARPVPPPLATIVFDDDAEVTVHAGGLVVVAPPEDRDDPRPERLLARMAAGQTLSEAARAEGLRPGQARELVG